MSMYYGVIARMQTPPPDGWGSHGNPGSEFPPVESPSVSFSQPATPTRVISDTYSWLSSSVTSIPVWLGIRKAALPKTRNVIPNHSIDEPVTKPSHPNHSFHNNKVKTTKYSILTFLPKNLFEQFHRFANLYFVFIVLLNFAPAINAFGKEIAMIPVIAVLCVTAVKDGFEDYRRYLSDKEINHMTCRVYCKCDKRYVKTEWQDVYVGDIVHLSCNEVIPADILFLRSSDDQGICFLETSNIDGESNLKQRQIVRGFVELQETFDPLKFSSTIVCDSPNSQIYKFTGSVVQAHRTEDVPVNKENLLLRGCVLKNTDYVEGIVVYAGHETKAMLNNDGPRYKRSKLERAMNRDVMWCVVILIVLCLFCAVGSCLWLEGYGSDLQLPFIPPGSVDRERLGYQGFVIFLTYIIVYQVIIPISLYVSLEIVKLAQVYFLNLDLKLYHPASDRRLECRAFNITEELGQVQHIFCDKTGTLTENKMIFRKCTIAGKDYPHLPAVNEEASKEVPLAQIATNLPQISKSACNSDRPYQPSIVSPLEESITSQAEDSNLNEFCIDSCLQQEAANICYETTLGIPGDRSDFNSLQDFLLVMSVCNTVVVSKRPHGDQMNESGEVDCRPRPFSAIENKFGFFAPIPKLYRRIVSSSVQKDGTNEKYLKSPDPDLVPELHSKHFFDFDKLISKQADAETVAYFEAESPDELALVYAANVYGVRLIKRTPDIISVHLPGGGIVHFNLLHVLPFDSSRKRMSVIVRHPDTNEIILYTKGADCAIMGELAPVRDLQSKEMVDKTFELLNVYAQQGLRTLCLAKRVLSEEEYGDWLVSQHAAETAIEEREKKLYESACQIETNLMLLGATGIEDRLQDGVPRCIASLREAGIKVWVLTGDKRETAINIANACYLFSPQMEVMVLSCRSKDATESLLQAYNVQVKVASPDNKFALVVDGHTLVYAMHKDCAMSFLELSKYCEAVLCCRATPSQKASVVKLVKRYLKVNTLAVGDGANDVAMIHAADVGIGISGQEGMQAVMASDFAISRFFHLQRLLLVHGHWCYERLARMILFFLYKNASYIFVLFWYSFYCGFSSQVMVDQVYLILYSLLFTSIQPLVIGIFDQDVPDILLIARPKLYKQGIHSSVYRPYSFWINMLDALYQSVVIFFIPYWIFEDSDLGMWELGTLSTTICVIVHTLHLSIETKSWTYVHIGSIALSLVIYLITIFLTSVVCLNCNPPSNPYWVTFHVMGRPLHWAALLLSVVVALFPRFLLRCILVNACPEDVTRAHIAYKNRCLSGSPDDFIATFDSTSSTSTLFRKDHDK